MIDEIWLPVVDFEGIYEVSNYGNVKSLERQVPGRWSGSTQTVRSRILKPSFNSFGYPTYWLRKDGATFPRHSHRLVLEAFVSKRPEGAECCHNDGNPKNNHVSNLRWDTKSNNHLDRHEHGTLPVTHPEPRHGLQHPGHRLTAEQVELIRKDPDPYFVIASKHGIGTMTAWRCKNYKSYRNLP